MEANEVGRGVADAEWRRKMLRPRPIMRHPWLGMRRRAVAAVSHGVLILGAIAVALPLYWMVLTSLKSSQAAMTFPPQWLVLAPHWSNYPKALTIEPFGRFFANSFVIAGLSSLLLVASSSMVGFAFSRLRWRGRDVLFLVVLATIMLPAQITLIPHFIIFRYLHWINTFLPLIVPSAFGGAFLVFLFRQFMLSLPRDLDDAARIDGCGYWRLYWQIVLPLCRPALGAGLVLSFSTGWHDLLGPLIYLGTPHLFTVSLGLNLFQGEFTTYWNLLMAASIVAIMPPLVLYYVFQRYFLQEMSLFAGLTGL